MNSLKAHLFSQEKVTFLCLGERVHSIQMPHMHLL